MFSRLALKTVLQQTKPGFIIRTAQSLTPASGGQQVTPASGGQQESVITFEGKTYVIKEGPERDLVNFPRPIRRETHPPVRHIFIPETWFTFFYEKTGVTGPYIFAASLTTYLLSKEIYVMDHEFSGGIAFFSLIAIGINKFKKPVTEWLDKELAQEDAELDEARDGSIRACENAIEEEKKEQWRSEGQLLLCDAKKENIAIQLEASYRERLDTVYREVKRRLDYQVEVLNIQRRIGHKHMISWIVSNVLKSITPQQEKEALDKCISDLKVLAASVK